MRLKKKIMAVVFMLGLNCVVANVFAVWTPLHGAVICNELATVESLVCQHPEWTLEPDNRGNIPLHYARGLKMVSLLIEKSDLLESTLSKQQLNTANFDCDTPLHYAIRSAENSAVIKYMIEHGAQLDASYSYMFNPAAWRKVHLLTGFLKTVSEPFIHTAVSAGRLDVVACLIDYGQSVNFMDDHSETPVYLAVRMGRMDILKYLVTKKADVNVVNRDYQTPLHIAAQTGRKDIVDYLVRNGAFVNARDADGNTPLHVAAQRGCRDVWNYLAWHGAEFDAENLKRETPIMIVRRVFG